MLSDAGEGAFARASYLEGLGVLAAQPVRSVADRLQVVQRWCLRPDGTLIYPAHRAGVVNALVLPFGNSMPSRQDRDVLLKFLTHHFGDPRLRPAQWIGMETAATIVRRWLTDQSLRQFFDVVSQANGHSAAWQERRAFWQAYYDDGWIGDAWVAFGPSCAELARLAFGAEVGFGRLTKGHKQVDRRHAVLMLNFGGCAVVDWSHNGYCNVWPAGEEGTPKLFRELYSSDAVQRASRQVDIDREVANRNMFQHHGSWQKRVARRIEELSGAYIPERSYRDWGHGR